MSALRRLLAPGSSPPRPAPGAARRRRRLHRPPASSAGCGVDAKGDRHRSVPDPFGDDLDVDPLVEELRRVRVAEIVQTRVRQVGAAHQPPEGHRERARRPRATVWLCKDQVMAVAPGTSRQALLVSSGAMAAKSAPVL